MAISTLQTICMSSSRILQPGICINSPVSLRRRGGLQWSSSGFRKGRGTHSTLAIKRALRPSFFSSAANADDCEVQHSRMMISTQTICMMSSSRVPQYSGNICISSPVSLSPWRRRRPEGFKWSSSGFRNGRGHSTLAIKQASSFFSSAEGATDCEVPAKETGVRDFTGTENVELMDPISPSKLVSTLDQLPPLLSMVIDGLPSLQMSKYVHEAEKCLHQYVERYKDVGSLGSYCHLGLSLVSYFHPGVISVDRFVALAINYALLFMLGDFFFDTPDEFHHNEYGISRDARESPQRIQEYLDHLDGVFSQQVQLCNSPPLIETLMKELGWKMLKLSNPKWFRKYVASVMEYHHASVASHVDIVQGHNLCFQDLESYTIMRTRNVAANLSQLAIEFANDTYIPDILRATPYLENITMTASIHVGYVNDIFSYHKESSLEQNPRNLIIVLMECEQKPFVQTVHRAIGLVNTYARTLIDLESEAWNSTLQNHLQDIKVLIIGNIYFSFMSKRYRHPHSVFVELQDMT